MDDVTFRAGLIRHLVKNGFDVHAAGSGDDGYGPRVESCGATFHDIPLAGRSRNPLRDLRLIWHLRQLYRQLDADVVHHFTIKPVIYGSIAARLARVPKVVCTITGLGYAFTSASGAFQKLTSGLYRFALTGADVVFFQNPDDRELFLSNRLVAPKKVLSVPGSGVDTRYYSPPEGPASDRREAGNVRFLFVGRLLADKGIYEYMAAAKLLESRPESIECHVLGDIDARNPTSLSATEMENAAQSGVVIWHGKTDDVRSFLEKTDVVVLPSYREGTPRSILEASAMGLPVIATDVPGCREAVDDGVTGLLVPAQDAQALAEAMSTFAREPAMRSRMGQAGREKMVREYDEEFVFAQTLEAYAA